MAPHIHKLVRRQLFELSRFRIAVLAHEVLGFFDADTFDCCLIHSLVRVLCVSLSSKVSWRSLLKLIASGATVKRQRQLSVRRNLLYSREQHMKRDNPGTTRRLRTRISFHLSEARTFKLSSSSFKFRSNASGAAWKIKNLTLNIHLCAFCRLNFWWRSVRRQLHVSLRGIRTEIWGKHSPPLHTDKTRLSSSVSLGCRASERGSGEAN